MIPTQRLIVYTGEIKKVSVFFATLLFFGNFPMGKFGLPGNMLCQGHLEFMGIGFGEALESRLAWDAGKVGDGCFTQAQVAPGIQTMERPNK